MPIALHIVEYAQHNEDISNGLAEAGLGHLLVGQTLYLKDPRNTPVEILSRDASTASFSVRVSDFEDVGAVWNLPLWDVSKFLVAAHAQMLCEDVQSALRDGCQKFNCTTEIAADAGNYTRAQAEISQLQNEISDWLVRSFPEMPQDQSAIMTGKQPCMTWSAALEKVMISRGLMDIDHAFAKQYASNPNAGEIIKGHRIILAELGFASYQGYIVRDPKTFIGEWAKSRRRAHILIRLAFMRAMFAMLQMTSVPLFRSVYSSDELTGPRNNGFVSTTFCADVASALFLSGQKTNFAATYWQRVPSDRVFMTYFETPELSRNFQESEAVLLFDQSNGLF